MSTSTLRELVEAIKTQGKALTEHRGQCRNGTRPGIFINISRTAIRGRHPKLKIVG